MKKACKNCKRILSGTKCPICKTSKVIETWKGKVIIIDAEKSEIAKKLSIKDSGEFAIRI